MEAIPTTAEDLPEISLVEENQLPDESLGIGDNAWATLAEVEQEHDTKPFFKSVRQFYCASIKKMLKKFPFGDSLMKDLGVLQPNKVSTYVVDIVLKLAKRFPQLKLDNEEKLTLLKEDFMDFRLSSDDLPQPQHYAASEDTVKPRVGKFWMGVFKMKTFDGSPRFPTLCQLMFGLMTIPCSN